MTPPRASRPMKRILLAALVVLSAASCTNIPYVALPPPPTGIRHDPNRFTVGIPTMSDTELARQQDLARAGDKRAAFNVYMHYRTTGNDQRKAMEWLLFAGELGHASAQYNLAQIYLHENDQANALLWAKRAKDSGYPNAQSLLESLQSQ